MTIQEVEKRTGLGRSHIRFYEKEGLFSPKRDKDSGYRNYTEEDVETIRKIAFLRTLGISVDEIRNIISGKLPLCQCIERQRSRLLENLTTVRESLWACDTLLKTGPASFEELDVDLCTGKSEDYWDRNRPVLRYDFAGLLYRLSSLKTWKILWALSLLISLVSYPGLPPEIPIQWNQGAAVTMGAKISIFAYPVILIVWRMILIPWLYVTLGNRLHKGLISEYAVNAVCFAGLTVEVFAILQAHDILAGGVLPLLAADAAALLGLLLLGLWELNQKA